MSIVISEEKFKELTDKLTRQLKNKVEPIQDYKSHKKDLSKDGYWNLGYYEGSYNALAEFLSMLDDIKEQSDSIMTSSDVEDMSDDEIQLMSIHDIRRLNNKVISSRVLDTLDNLNPNIVEVSDAPELIKTSVYHVDLLDDTEITVICED